VGIAVDFFGYGTLQYFRKAAIEMRPKVERVCKAGTFRFMGTRGRAL